MVTGTSLWALYLANKAKEQVGVAVEEERPKTPKKSDWGPSLIQVCSVTTLAVFRVYARTWRTLFAPPLRLSPSFRNIAHLTN